MSLKHALLTRGSFFAINKPLGMTSHDVVAKVRGILRRFVNKKNQKQTKLVVGHLGTLDPQASGVLTLAVGHAAKFIQYAQVDPQIKIYTTTVTLGKSTSTDDQDEASTGYKVLREVDMSWLTKEHVESHLSTFIGDIMQRPPTVSAKKINGVRAHTLERQGRMTAAKARPISVRIDDLELLNFVPGRLPQVELRVTCGSGTYIRSLARDLGQQILQQNAETYVLGERSSFFEQAFGGLKRGGRSLMPDSVWDSKLSQQEYVPGCGSVLTLERNYSNGFDMESMIELDELADIFDTKHLVLQGENARQHHERIAQFCGTKFKSVYDTIDGLPSIDIVRKTNTTNKTNKTNECSNGGDTNPTPSMQEESESMMMDREEWDTRWKKKDWVSVDGANLFVKKTRADVETYQWAGVSKPTAEILLNEEDLVRVVANGSFVGIGNLSNCKQFVKRKIHFQKFDDLWY